MPARPPVLTLVSPVGRVAAGTPIVLRWRPLRDAAGYRAVMSDSTGHILFTALALDTAVAVSDTIRLAPGAPYAWSVEAQMRDGTVVTAPPIEFRVASKDR